MIYLAIQTPCKGGHNLRTNTTGIRTEAATMEDGNYH